MAAAREELAKKLVQLTLALEGHPVMLLLTQEFVNELHCTQLRDSTAVTTSAAMIQVRRMPFMVLDLVSHKDKDCGCTALSLKRHK